MLGLMEERAAKSAGPAGGDRLMVTIPMADLEGLRGAIVHLMARAA